MTDDAHVQRDIQALAARAKRKLAPAKAECITAAERALGRPLPPSLRAFYTVTDGLELDALGWLRLLRVADLEPHATGLRSWGVPDEWGYIPIAWCEGTSDRLCISTHPHLDGRIVLVPHDDGPRLLFSDLAPLLTELVAQGAGRRRRDAGWDLHSLRGDYASRPLERSERDAADARALLDRYRARLAENGADVIAEHAVAFACTLLPPSEVETLLGLIDILVPYERHATDRLRAIGTPGARAALGGYYDALVALAERLSGIARAAGHDATITPDEEERVGSLLVRTSARPMHLSVQHWYARRADPALEAAFRAFLDERVARAATR